MRERRYCGSLIGRLRLRPTPLIRRRSLASGSTNWKNNRCTVSFCASDVLRFRELAKRIPDVRQDKVTSIKKQIESGVYNVPARLVAESIADLHTKLYSKNTPKS